MISELASYLLSSDVNVAKTVRRVMCSLKWHKMLKYSNSQIIDTLAEISDSAQKAGQFAQVILVMIFVLRGIPLKKE